MTSGAYTKAYNEVKAIGRRTGSARTPEQTTLALFYGGNFLTIMQGALRTVALARITNIGDCARLFALANMSAADALDQRLGQQAHSTTSGARARRSRTATTTATRAPMAIRRGCPLPAGNPPYPDYTSGANSITGATMRSLENFFGDDVWTFNRHDNALENGLPIAPRTYHSFSAVADDVVEARILLGIHFRFADVVARRQAKQSADQVFAHTLQPLD